MTLSPSSSSSTASVVLLLCLASQKVPDDLKANMIDTLMQISMAQAQHVTIRKAQMQVGQCA